MLKVVVQRRNGLCERADRDIVGPQLPQGLKPTSLLPLNGTTEVVPFPTVASQRPLLTRPSQSSFSPGLANTLLKSSFAVTSAFQGRLGTKNGSHECLGRALDGTGNFGRFVPGCFRVAFVKPHGMQDRLNDRFVSDCRVDH